MRQAFALLAVLFLAFAVSAQTLPKEGGAPLVPLPMFPPNHWWNVDVSHAPVDTNSSTYIANIPTWQGLSSKVHGDFGGDAGGGQVYGFPYIVVTGNQPKVTVDFSAGYPGESDGVDHNTNTSFPFYPIPTQAITNTGWIEGGWAGNDPSASGDRHMLIVDSTNNSLYELYSVAYDTVNSKWTALSGAFWDMNTNNERPVTWTSADAAGLQIVPGLVRYDEVYGPNEITHAFRVTLQKANSYVFPATHAGNTAGGLPYGTRLRLKATKDCSTFVTDVQKICRALQKYGLIFADQGSNMYVSGNYDPNWNMSVINSSVNGLGTLLPADFEVVQLGWNPSTALVITGPSVVGTGEPNNFNVTAYNWTCCDLNGHATYGVATGYRGTVHFTTTDSSFTLPADYTFTAADNGAHSFAVTLRTAGGQTLYATDTGDQTITGSHNVVVGPQTPTGLVATANGTPSVSLSWNPVSGASQYEIYRLSASAPYASLATTTSASISDATVSAGATYVYKVRALDASSNPSPFSTPDAATTILFTDDPLVASSTTIKAVHLAEVRQAVNAMRAAAGMTAATFTDSSLTGIAIKAVHIQELRTDLDAARAALGLPVIAYTDPSLTTGMTARAAHVQELRSGVE